MYTIDPPKIGDIVVRMGVITNHIFEVSEIISYTNGRWSIIPVPGSVKEYSYLSATGIVDFKESLINEFEWGVWNSAEDFPTILEAYEKCNSI